MNGAHDMGGMQGFGPINPEPEATEPVFHAEWERPVFALTLACGMLGKWNIDMSRHARERQLPADYLRNSYYETWFAGLNTLLLDAGLATRQELETGQMVDPASDIQAPDRDQAVKILEKGGPTLMDTPIAQDYQVGDRVRVVNAHPAGHTRMPRYVRGRVGVIDHYNGVHVFADANAQGRREGEPQYNVRFSARELWGDDAPAADGVYLDLWQPYLEPA